MAIEDGPGQLTKESAQGLANEYFFQIAQPLIPTEQASSGAQHNLSLLFGHYEKGLIADANYYQDHPEMLMSVNREGLFGKGEINHFQLAIDCDQATLWGVEMKLDEPKNSRLWIPRTIAYVRMLRSSLDGMKNCWVYTDAFLHPYGGEGYYNRYQLKGDILSYTLLETDEQGKIVHLKNQIYDKAARVNLMQEVNIDRTPSPESSYPTFSNTRDIMESILKTLPLEKVEMKGVIAEESYS